MFLKDLQRNSVANAIGELIPRFRSSIDVIFCEKGGLKTLEPLSIFAMATFKEHV